MLSQNYFIAHRQKLMSAVPPAVQYSPPSGKRAVYYLTDWSIYGRKYFPKDIPIDRVTDIVYAFFNISANGDIFSGDPDASFENMLIGNGVEPQNSWWPESPRKHRGIFGQFVKLKEQGKKFNFQLGLGGWSWSKKYSDAVSTAANRQNFVNSLKKLVLDWPGLISGFSHDWEYISGDGKNYGLDGNVCRKEDPQNFIELLKLIRATFPNFTNALCVSADPSKMTVPIKEMSQYLDQIQIMSYDFCSPLWGDRITAHHTNPRKSSFGKWSAEQAADFFIAQGVPASKQYIGGALYSRGFGGTDGFGKPADGTNSPDFEFPEEPGVCSYHMLPRPGATEYIDPESKGAYSYDAKRRVCNTYDNIVSIAEKCKIVWEKNLGGIIFWEASGDVRDYNSPRSIMRTVAENLTHCAPKVNPQPPAPAPAVVKPAPPPAVKPKPVVLKPVSK